MKLDLRRCGTRKDIRQRWKLCGKRVQIDTGKVEACFVGGDGIQVGTKPSAELSPIELAIGVRKLEMAAVQCQIATKTVDDNGRERELIEGESATRANAVRHADRRWARIQEW